MCGRLSEKGAALLFLYQMFANNKQNIIFVMSLQRSSGIIERKMNNQFYFEEAYTGPNDDPQVYYESNVGDYVIAKGDPEEYYGSPGLLTAPRMKAAWMLWDSGKCAGVFSTVEAAEKAAAEMWNELQAA
jgi:hypothetical protein